MQINTEFTPIEQQLQNPPFFILPVLFYCTAHFTHILSQHISDTRYIQSSPLTIVHVHCLTADNTVVCSRVQGTWNATKRPYKSFAFLTVFHINSSVLVLNLGTPCTIALWNNLQITVQDSSPTSSQGLGPARIVLSKYRSGVIAQFTTSGNPFIS